MYNKNKKRLKNLIEIDAKTISILNPLLQKNKLIKNKFLKIQLEILQNKLFDNNIKSKYLLNIFII